MTWNTSSLLHPWQKQVKFLVELVCLSVCLFVDITQKSYERIVLTFFEGFLGGTVKN